MFLFNALFFDTFQVMGNYVLSPSLSKGEGAIKVTYYFAGMAPFPLGRVGDGIAKLSN
jgi:hypothetical protein